MLPPQAPVNSQFTQNVVPPSPMAPPPVVLPEGLRALERHHQFIVYRRADKAPVNPITGIPSDKKSYQMSYQAALEAAAKLPGDYRVGFVLTLPARKAVVDIDTCRDPFTGKLSDVALFIIALLQGAYVEVSVSGTGIHIWFSYSGEMPTHAMKVASTGEFYHDDRYFALGTPYVAESFVNGSADADMTAMLPALIAVYFQPTAADAKMDWSEGHELGLELPPNDELIQRALKFTSAGAAFGDKASFADLWTRNVEKLSKAFLSDNGGEFDESAADFALAGKLAWLTGNDGPRIERLMRQSALVRDKWDWHATYMERTIQGALVKDGEFWDPKYRERQAGALSPGAAGLPPALTVPSGAADEMNPEDFWSHLPSHKYINTVTRELIPVDALNGSLKRFTDSLGMKPSAWLDMCRAVQQMGWQPEHPEIIEGKVSVDGILRDDPKGRIYNLFRPSDAVASDGDPSPWVNHVRSIYPEETDYLFKWMAFCIQNPGKKINHAVVLGGNHGIGKDWMLQALRYGVGAGNFEDIEYAKIFDDYSEWSERTLLVINEARDTGGVDRYEFYQKSKRIIAAPPDTLPCRKMYLGNYYVPNVMAVVITSNNKLNGLFIDPDDRRYYVAWSSAEKQGKAYFDPLWEWMDSRGGKQAVLGYLQRLDISGFSPMAPPPKTEAWHQIVDAGRNPEEKELSDALEGVQVATVKEIVAKLQFGGHHDLAATLQDRKKARQIPHLLSSVGFDVLRNQHTTDGRWVIAGHKETLYADRNLPVSERMAMANKRMRGQA